MEANGLKLALNAGDVDDGDTGRRTRGALIAGIAKISKNKLGYSVPSASGNGTYIVNVDDDEPFCSCPDFELRRLPCKHVYSVEYLIRREEHGDGTVVETKAVRVTYKQNWRAYNAAQQNEGRHFVELLRELCDTVEQPEYNFGRPTLPLSDVIFGMLVKVYSTMSGRRVESDIKELAAKGLLDKAPSVATCWRGMEKPEMTPLLEELIERSALPLASLDTHFSPDSTGFASKTYVRWFDKKWGKEVKEAKWVKAHLMSGALTNIVTAAKVTEEAGNDSPHLIPFLHTTVKHFDVEEVSADKAYLGKKNLREIKDAGATALIPFKVNSVAHNPKRKRDRVWERAFHFFNLHRDEFLDLYHKRSNVESTIGAIKAKMGASLRSKTPTAMVNETLCKILAYNITVLIAAMYEYGISPEFFASEPVEEAPALNTQSVMALA